MSLAYLLDPITQHQNRAGVNNVHGFFKVYISDTDDTATTYSNFSGALNPEEIDIDNNGRAVIIADNSLTYRVEMYDKTGNLLYTQYPVWCLESGGGVSDTVSIECSDGSINVDKTSVGSAVNYDLSVNREHDDDYLQWIKTVGFDMADGYYKGRYSEGTMEVGTKGIKVSEGQLYHVTAHVSATKGAMSGLYDEATIAISTLDSEDTVLSTITVDRIVDYSLGLAQQFEVSADIKAESDGEIVLGIGSALGGSYSLLDMEVHRVYSGVPYIPNGIATRDWVSENYQEKLDAGANIQILGNVISATDTTYTAGAGINLVGTEFSANTNVLATKTDLSGKQDVLTAGSNITIDNNVISANFESSQANWAENDSSAPSYIQNKPDLSVYATTQALETGLSGKQDTLTAGNNITITNNVISSSSNPQVQADWAQTNSEAVDFINHKPQNLVQDANYVHTDNNFTDSDKNKLDGIEAGAEVNVQASWTESDTSSDAYIQNKPDLSLKEDVANKVQSIVANSQTDYPSSYAVAGYVNSSIATNTAKFLGNFTLTDLTLTYPATNAQIETALDGYTFSTAPTNNDYVYVEIQDPQTPSVTAVVKRFKFDGTNWLYEYSLNNSSFTSAEIAAIDSGINATKVGNYDNHIADTTIHVTSSDKTTWNGKQDAISDLGTIRSGAEAGATAVQPGDLATVATTGSYNSLTDTPTIPTVPVQDVEVDGVSVLNAQGIAEITMPTFTQAQANWTEDDSNDPSYIQNKPALSAVAVSGSYNDLTDTPTIPSVPVQDVTVDGVSVVSNGVAEIMMPSIPVTDVEVDGVSVVNNGVASITMPTFTQSQANWTEVDSNSPSYIQNKPVLSAVATSGAYSDLSGTPTINNVPAVTSSDDNKVLKASYSGGVGSYSWENESGGTVTDVEVNGTSVVSGGVASITVPTVDQTYDSSSTNAQSGVAVASAIGGVEQVPAVTLSDDGKVLTASYSGGVASYSWGTAPSGVPAYTTSEDGKVLGVVENQGTAELDWVAPPAGGVTDVEVNGTSVVSGGVASITVPTVDQAYNASSTNAQSGVAVASAISGKQNTLTAGDGIDITNNVIKWLNTAGITDIQYVQSLPANPGAHTLYLIPET